MCVHNELCHLPGRFYVQKMMDHPTFGAYDNFNPYVWTLFKLLSPVKWDENRHDIWYIYYFFITLFVATNKTLYFFMQANRYIYIKKKKEKW